MASGREGVAAVETALIAPVAVALLGLVAIWGQAYAIQRKVTLAAHTITDLVTQQGTQATNSTTCTPGNQSTQASVNQLDSRKHSQQLGERPLPVRQTEFRH